MSLDLTGITNENEFYTHHYLAAILESDLKPFFEKWTSLEIKPWEDLRRLARPFQGMRKELASTSDAEERLSLQRAWFADLFKVLGYCIQPDTVELEAGELLYLAGQVTRANGQPELWFIEALDGRDEEDPLVA